MPRRVQPLPRRQAGSIEAAIALEDRNQILCAQTEDFREGLKSFLTRKPPVWKDA